MWSLRTFRRCSIGSVSWIRVEMITFGWATVTINRSWVIKSWSSLDAGTDRACAGGFGRVIVVWTLAEAFYEISEGLDGINGRGGFEDSL